MSQAEAHDSVKRNLTSTVSMPNRMLMTMRLDT